MSLAQSMDTQGLVAKVTLFTGGYMLEYICVCYPYRLMSLLVNHNCQEEDVFFQHYRLDFYVLSFLMIDKDALRRRDGATGALNLMAQVAGKAGPGWTGRMGGQVTSHKLVVLLVGRNGQRGLTLETGSQVGYLQGRETWGHRLQGVKIAVGVKALRRPVGRRGHQGNLLFRWIVDTHAILVEVLGRGLGNRLEVEEHGSLRGERGVNCWTAEVMRQSRVVAPVIDGAEVNQDTIRTVAGGVTDILCWTVGGHWGTSLLAVHTAGHLIFHSVWVLLPTSQLHDARCAPIKALAFSWQ